MARTFHLLTESEPFSEFDGGAISRWTANVTRQETDSIILAPATDHTWTIDRSRVRVVSGLSAYKRFNEKGGHRLPWIVRIAILKIILGRALSDLEAGDVVWVHNRPEFALALQSTIERRGARLFLHLHNSHLVEWSERITMALAADCYVFVSRFLERQALNKFSHLKRTEVLYNGADQGVFYPHAEQRPSNVVPVVLFAGRLVPEKGLHIFLEAMQLLNDRKIGVQGVVVGAAGFGHSSPTPYIQAMQEMAPSNVRFAPYCSGSELGAMFRDADIFCLPSCWDEPLGMAPLEAMASRLPIVVTNTGGLPEVLAGGGGILVGRDSAIELADGLEILATNRDLRERLAEEAYASFQKRFTWNATFFHYRQILQHPSVDVICPPSAVHGSKFA